LRRGEKIPHELSEIYRKRRDLVVRGLRSCGLEPFEPRATFYVWSPVPGGVPSKDFCKRLLVESGVVVTPGVGFGEHGEGYFRISLTQPEDRLKEALFRMEQVAGVLW